MENNFDNADTSPIDMLHFFDSFQKSKGAKKVRTRKKRKDRKKFKKLHKRLLKGLKHEKRKNRKLKRLLKRGKEKQAVKFSWGDFFMHAAPKVATQSVPTDVEAFMGETSEVAIGIHSEESVQI